MVNIIIANSTENRRRAGITNKNKNAGDDGQKLQAKRWNIKREMQEFF